MPETLVIPLYGRKVCSELYPNLYRDDTGRSCDNGTCKIYNLDFSGVIAVRDALLPAGDQEENIACDLKTHRGSAASTRRAARYSLPRAYSTIS